MVKGQKRMTGTLFLIGTPIGNLQTYAQDL